MNTSLIILAVMTITGLTMTSARPGHFLYSFPAASSQTSVVKDALGNQATSYAYQDGHSSSVFLNRNDVSKHLTYVPVPAPVVYQEAVVPAYHHVQAPAAHYYDPGYYGYY